MKTFLSLSMLGAALALTAQAAEPEETLAAAVKALKEKGAYAWTTSTEIAGSQFNFGPTKGRTEKDGFTVISAEANGESTHAVQKSGKAIVRTEEGWKTADELPQPGGGGGRGGFMARRLLTTVQPAEEAAKLLDGVKEIKAGDGGLFSVVLSDTAATELASFRRGGRGGGAGANAPAPKNAKATVKFWVKDGVLSKYEIVSEATVRFGQDGEEREVKRTTTVELSEIGSAKVEVPEEAKKKLQP